MNKLLSVVLVTLTACVGIVEEQKNLLCNDKSETLEAEVVIPPAPIIFPTSLDPYEVLNKALIDWERDFGDVGQECRDKLLTVTVSRGDDWNHTGELCGGKARAGCFYVTLDENGRASNFFIVYTKDDEEEYVLYHEFVHWVLYCTTGKVDGNHATRDYWEWTADMTGANDRTQ